MFLTVFMSWDSLKKIAGHGQHGQGANVLVGVDSLVKLADFGCSKRAKDRESSSSL